MREVDLIIFDFDGTLVDSRLDIVNSVNYVLKRLDLNSRDFDTIISFIGEGIEHLLLKSLGEGREDRYEEAYRFYVEYYQEHLLDNSVAYPHVRETLDHFKSKKMIIISNRLGSSASVMLERLGLIQYFKDILGGEDHSCRKPSGCPILNMLNKFGVSKERAIIVGDMDLDIMSGKDAGVLTCAVTYGIGSRESIVKAGPDFIIDDISRLKDIID